MPTDEHNYILNKVTLLQLEYNLILDITKILLEFRRQLKMTTCTKSYGRKRHVIFLILQA